MDFEVLVRSNGFSPKVAKGVIRVLSERGPLTASKISFWLYADLDIKASAYYLRRLLPFLERYHIVESFERGRLKYWKLAGDGYAP